MDVLADKELRRLEKRRASYNKANRKPSGRFRNLKIAAKNRNIEVKITLEEYKELILNKTCEYCSYPLCETAGGLDRMDSSKGYEIGNLVPCCGQCNNIKSNIWSYEEMKEIGKVVKTLKDRRNYNEE